MARFNEMVSGKCPCAADMTSFNETPDPPKTNHGDRISGRKRCSAPAKRVPSSFICWESLAQHALGATNRPLQGDPRSEHLIIGYDD